MTHIEIFLLVSALLSASLFCHYLDARYNWQLSAWFYGLPVNPFRQTQTSTSQPDSQTDAKEAEIAALKERIATLEKIVTEPAYELNQELRNLCK